MSGAAQSRGSMKNICDFQDVTGESVHKLIIGGKLYKATLVRNKKDTVVGERYCDKPFMASGVCPTSIS